MANDPKVASGSTPSAQASSPFSALDSFVKNGSTDTSEPPPAAPNQFGQETSSAPQASKATAPQASSDSVEMEEGESVQEAASAKKFLEVPVTDERGRRMVKVDLGDEDAMKRVVARAHQAQQLLSRVNKAEDSNKKMTARLAELEGNWKKLDEVFAQHGEEGLIDMLRGKQGAFKEWEEQRYARRKFMETASEEERRTAELEERLARIEKEKEITAKRLADKDKEYADRESAQLEQDLVNRLTPVFTKYRFEGKLGDVDAEDMLDEKIWDRALGELEKLPEDQLTQNAINQAFRAAYLSLSKVMQARAKTEAKRQVEATKKQAAQTVQAAVKGQKVSNGSAAVDKARSDIKSGNWSDFFMDALNGKVKLTKNR